MEEENRGGAKGETLAPGLRGPTVVRLADGTSVIVKRWSWAKSQLVMALFEGIWSELLSLKMEGAVDAKAVRRKIFDLLGPSAVELTLLSVDEKDREKVRAAAEDFEDMADILNAVLDKNLTEAVIKKALALVGKLTRVIPTGA